MLTTSQIVDDLWETATGAKLGDAYLAWRRGSRGPMSIECLHLANRTPSVRKLERLGLVEVKDFGDEPLGEWRILSRRGIKVGRLLVARWNRENPEDQL